MNRWKGYGKIEGMGSWFQPKKIFVSLFIFISLLFIAHLLTQYIIGQHNFDPSSVRYQLLWKFNLDEERSLGTWYSQIALFVAAALALTIGFIKKIRKEKWGLWWIVLGGVLIYLSIDESVSIHEMLMAPTQDILGIHSGILFNAWIIPVAIVVALFGLIYFNFWLHLPKKTRILFFVAAVVYIGGAIGMEMIAANYYSTNWGGYVPAGSNPLLIIIPGIEEFLEMFGVAIFIYALVDYLSRQPLPSQKHTTKNS